jgi:hypothetical protein
MYGSLGLPELLVLVVIAAAVIWPASRVCAKAGYSPWLGLAAFIPGRIFFYCGSSHSRSGRGSVMRRTRRDK